MIFPLMISVEKGPQNQSLLNPGETPITDWQKPQPGALCFFKVFFCLFKNVYSSDITKSSSVFIWYEIT